MTNILDVNGIRIGLRAFRDHRMDERFMERFVRQIDEFVQACKMKLLPTQHLRGSFAQAIFGYNHGMGEGNNVRQLISSNACWLNFPRSHIVSLSTKTIKLRLTICCAARKCVW
jgi:hypothetical protein